MGPTGFVSVSPVERQATSETTKEKDTDTSPSQTAMWNAKYCKMIRQMVIGTRPMNNQEFGTSTEAEASRAELRSDFLKMLNARAMVRQFHATCVRLEKTISDTPPHNPQRLGLKSPAALMAKEGT